MVAAKFAGMLSERLGQPSVLGELLVGILLGNAASALLIGSGVAFVRFDPSLRVLAEMGVLILLFDVGLEVDLRAMVRVGPSAVLVGLIGVAAPLARGGPSRRGCCRTTPPSPISSSAPRSRRRASGSRPAS